MAKEDLYKGKWEGIRHAQAQNAYNRDKARAARDATRHQLLDAKKNVVNSVKQTTQSHLMVRKKQGTL